MTYRIQKIHDLIDETDIAWNMFLNYLESSNYFEVFNVMDEKERRYYNNKLCSDLAVICEKYSKALYLKTATIPESIISRLNLNDDDVVNLIIGSNDARTGTIHNQLTRDEKQQIQELKFQGISHNFTRLFNNDNEFLKNMQFYFNGAMKDLKNLSDSDLEELLYSDKIYDAFVKGRYSSLNDYTGDFDALITLCETLQRGIIQGESIFDMDCVEIIPESNFNLINGFYNYKESIVGHTSIYGGYQPKFRAIKHIYPILESKITVQEKEGEKEYYFGEHLPYNSLYKFVQANGINQAIRKSPEELANEIEHAHTQRGIYSLETEGNNGLEFREPLPVSALSISDGEFVIFEDNGGQHIIPNINGQLFLTNYELIKGNSDDKEATK